MRQANQLICRCQHALNVSERHFLANSLGDNPVQISAFRGHVFKVESPQVLDRFTVSRFATQHVSTRLMDSHYVPKPSLGPIIQENFVPLARLQNEEVPKSFLLMREAAM